MHICCPSMYYIYNKGKEGRLAYLESKVRTFAEGQARNTIISNASKFHLTQ